MSEYAEVDISEMFGTRLPSTSERLQAAYADPIVHERSAEIIRTAGEDRLALQAQLVTYLAAGHTLFPVESQIILDSFNRDANVR